MAFKVGWLLENRILLEESSGTYDIDQLHKATTELNKLADHGISPVHFIIDSTRVTQNLLEVDEIEATVGDLHRSKNMGWVQFIVPNMASGFLASRTSRVRDQKYRQASSIQDALEFLTVEDKTLPNIEVLLKRVQHYI